MGGGGQGDFPTNLKEVPELQKNLKSKKRGVKTNNTNK